jgi:hypothetical protein
MVIQGYGIDPFEQDDMEARDFHERWQREKERIAQSTPIHIRRRLEDIYASIPHEKLFTTPSQFADDISWRVYTEACMNSEEKFNPDNYHGEALTQFIGKEIYFASERASKKGLLEQPPLNENPGEKISTKVLEGVVKRAIELFSDWNGITEPPSKRAEEHGVYNYIYEDKRNLRDSLESYVGF